jgi:hypothetical protein
MLEGHVRVTRGFQATLGPPHLLVALETWPMFYVGDAGDVIYALFDLITGI